MFEELREAALLVRRGKRVLLVEREPGERWAGMWDFPRFPLESEEPGRIGRELQRHLREQLGIEAEVGRQLTTLRHGVTRFRITLSCHEALYRGKAAATTRNLKWLTADELAHYPLNTTGRKLSRWVNDQ